MAFRAAEYDRYTGERSKMPTWWPICTATLRRGWASKWVRRLTFASMIIAFGFTMLLYFMYQVMPDWRTLMEQFGRMVDPEEENFVLDAHKYLGLLRIYVNPILLPLSLVFGYDLIAADLRSNAFESYFSRSITPFSYLLGRTLAYVGFLMLATLAPMLWIWAFDVSTGPEGHFAEVASVPLGMGLAMLTSAFMLSLLVQAVTTLTRSGIWTNLTFVVIFLFSGAIGAILWNLTDNPNFFAINLLHCVKVYSSVCMGTTDQLDEVHASPALATAVIFGIIVVSLAILMRSLKRRSLVG
jgi:hypothetical protein